VQRDQQRNADNEYYDRNKKMAVGEHSLRRRSESGMLSVRLTHKEDLLRSRVIMCFRSAAQIIA